MARLVFVSHSQALDRFNGERDDILVPLTDAARDDLSKDARWGAKLAALPEWGVLQSAALTEAFQTARGILRTLNADSAWRDLLYYHEVDLRPMALKNIFFALEQAALVYWIARRAADLYPGATAVLVEGDPDVRRAVAAAIPAVVSPGGAGRVPTNRLRGIRARLLERVRPLARWGRDRWLTRKAERPAIVSQGSARPVVCFLDAPHRARIMTRTLALLARDHPIHNAQSETGWTWPDDLAFKPGLTYAWYAYQRRGAGRRIARHILLSKASTRLDRFDLPGKAWLPPRLLWTLRYDDIQRYANMIEALEGLADTVRPALWITLEDLFAFGKCVAAVGDRRGIPTLDVQHGIIGAYPYRTGVDVVGTFAAFGEASRQTLIERGADPDRIVVTGPVRYDDIFDLKPDREEMMWTAGLDPARPLVMFASQPVVRTLTEASKRVAVRALLDAAHHLGAQVIIKAHPLEDLEQLRALVGDPSVLITREQLYEWLLVCDVMATICSTVIYEAAMAERPALLLDWSGLPVTDEYLKAGIGLLPPSPEQVEETLWKLLTDDDTRTALRAAQRAFVVHNLGGNDGKASERLAALARQLMGESGPNPLKS